MIYEMLIQTFKDGDWFLGFIFWLISMVVVALLFTGANWCLEEWRWKNTQAFKWPAELVSVSYAGSTERTSSVPVVTGNGVGVGMVTTGNPEQFITLWDCGKYGRVVVDDENLFRVAQKEMTLYLKKRGVAVRVDGWENP